MKKIILLLSFLSLIGPLVFGENEEEHFLYSIHAFDGGDYKKTFSNEYTDTIYFLADVDNFLSTRKAYIYYWPPMQRWRLNAPNLNYPLEGTIKVRGKNKDDVLESVKISYRTVQVGFNKETKVFKGEAAESVYKQYNDAIEFYEKTMADYWDKRDEYIEVARELNGKIKKARERGEDVSGLVNELQEMYPPRPQVRKPNYIVDIPVKMYVLNLPEGEYKIAFYDEQGSLMEGSEKKLKVITMSRESSVSYQVASKELISKPRRYRDPGGIIYVNGTQPLFLKADFQNQFNDFYYQKLINNDGNGNWGVKRWVTTMDVQYCWLEVRGRENEIILEDPFINQPDVNDSNRSEVVLFESPGPRSDLSADFSAFLLPINKDERVIHLKMRDYDGNALKGSERQVRVVRSGAFLIVLVVAGFIPLLVMLVVLIKRSTLYRSEV